MEEFKRVFGIKFIMVFTVTMLLSIGLFVYSSSEGKSMSDIRQETHYRQWIIGELSDMQPEEALEIANIQSDSVIKRKYDELEPEEQTVYSRQLNKIKEQLELTEEQIKIDLRELSRAKLLEQKGKDKKYMLSEMAQIKISSFWTKM